MYKPFDPLLLNLTILGGPILCSKNTWHYLEFIFNMSGIVYTRGKSLQGWLGDVNLWNNLGFSLYTVLFICCMVVISGGRKKSEIRVSVDWYIVIEY